MYLLIYVNKQDEKQTIQSSNLEWLKKRGASLKRKGEHPYKIVSLYTGRIEKFWEL